MTDPPIFSKTDADWILKRAAEIEGSEDTKPMSAEELRAIATEAGFGARAVERAMAEAQRAAVTGAHRPPVQRWGLIRTRISTIRSIPVDIRSEELMRAVRLFQPYREGPAQVKLEEDRITWRDAKGIRFTVSSAGGVTEIRVYLSKFLIRKGRWMGWVKAAADRLETLVFLMATQDPPAHKLLPHIPEG
jgi:hypothetical protein